MGFLPLLSSPPLRFPHLSVLSLRLGWACSLVLLLFGPCDPLVMRGNSFLRTCEYNYFPMPLLCPLLWSHLTYHLMKQYKMVGIKNSRDLLGVRKREKAVSKNWPLYNCNKISVSLLRSSGENTAFRGIPPQQKWPGPSTTF